MTDQDVVVAKPPQNDEEDRPDRSLAEQLVEQARADGVDLVGPGGHAGRPDEAGPRGRAGGRDGCVTAERKQVARELIADIRRLDQAIANNRERCQAAVTASGTTLTTIRGISDVLAAKILGHVGDVRRFASSDHLASYAGTAPIEASSGDVVRHRLSRRGNRQLNNAVHLAAHVQTIFPGQGRTYYERQLTAGKSRTEALRSLKRQLIKTIYRTRRWWLRPRECRILVHCPLLPPCRGHELIPSRCPSGRPADRST